MFTFEERLQSTTSHLNIDTFCVLLDYFILYSSLKVLYRIQDSGFSILFCYAFIDFLNISPVAHHLKDTAVFKKALFKSKRSF